MKLFRNSLFIFYAVVLLSVFGDKAALADITGKVGVGTWNTQAEFAEVKVVQGTQTLYQSDFTAGMTGWTTSGGTWLTQNGYLRQTGTGTPAIAWVGNTTWSNYTLTLKARKISGDEGVSSASAPQEIALIGAGAWVTGRTKVPPGSMVLGSPAKVVRPLSQQEQQLVQEWAQRYVTV